MCVSRQNCILADEMGLGKTIQSITFLQEIVNYGIRGPFLVIAPLSTIPNWQREFETWTDMNAIVYHGTTPSRNMLQEYEMFYKDEEVGRGDISYDLSNNLLKILTNGQVAFELSDLYRIIKYYEVKLQ